jgi:hypothetical protein
MQTLYKFSEEFRKKCSSLSSANRIRTEKGLERQRYVLQEESEF